MSEYAHGAHEDSLGWQDGHATREDAIADGETEYDEHFVTGRVWRVKASRYFQLDLPELFDQIADCVSNNEGEWAEAYAAKWRALANGDPADAGDLMSHLWKAFDEWAVTQGMTPDFFRVVEMQHHDAKPDKENPDHD